MSLRQQALSSYLHVCTVQHLDMSVGPARIHQERLSVNLYKIDTHTYIQKDRQTAGHIIQRSGTNIISFQAGIIATVHTGLLSVI